MPSRPRMTTKQRKVNIIKIKYEILHKKKKKVSTRQIDNRAKKKRKNSEKSSERMTHNNRHTYQTIEASVYLFLFLFFFFFYRCMPYECSIVAMSTRRNRNIIQV